MVHGRPQAEEKDDDQIDNREDVRHRTKNARYTPGAPRKFLTREVGESVWGARVKLDVAAEPAPEKKHGYEKI